MKDSIEFEDRAFPFQQEWEVYIEHARGLTKRQYYAAKALQGLATDHTYSPHEASELAVEYADALIEALND